MQKFLPIIDFQTKCVKFKTATTAKDKHEALQWLAPKAELIKNDFPQWREIITPDIVVFMDYLEKYVSNPLNKMCYKYDVFITAQKFMYRRNVLKADFIHKVGRYGKHNKFEMLMAGKPMTITTFKDNCIIDLENEVYFVLELCDYMRIKLIDVKKELD